MDNNTGYYGTLGYGQGYVFWLQIRNNRSGVSQCPSAADNGTPISAVARVISAHAHSAGPRVPPHPVAATLDSRRWTPDHIFCCTTS